jgi:hypothetical protein
MKVSALDHHDRTKIRVAMGQLEDIRENIGYISTKQLEYSRTLDKDEEGKAEQLWSILYEAEGTISEAIKNFRHFMMQEEREQ